MISENKRRGQIVMWDYIKWILYAILISMQLSFLLILAKQGGMPEVHTATLRTTTLLYETLASLPPVWQPEDPQRLGLTEGDTPGTCKIRDPLDKTVGVIRITLSVNGRTTTCVWPSLTIYQAFDVSSRITRGTTYTRTHMTIPLHFTNGEVGILRLTSIGREGKPVIISETEKTP